MSLYLKTQIRSWKFLNLTCRKPVINKLTLFTLLDCLPVTQVSAGKNYCFLNFFFEVTKLLILIVTTKIIPVNVSDLLQKYITMVMYISVYKNKAINCLCLKQRWYFIFFHNNLQFNHKKISLKNDASYYKSATRNFSIWHLGHNKLKNIYRC